MSIAKNILHKFESVKLKTECVEGDTVKVTDESHGFYGKTGKVTKVEEVDGGKKLATVDFGDSTEIINDDRIKVVESEKSEAPKVRDFGIAEVDWDGKTLSFFQVFATGEVQLRRVGMDFDVDEAALEVEPDEFGEMVLKIIFSNSGKKVF